MAGINIKFREVKKILIKNGWVVDRNSGDHIIFIKDNKHISIPFHPNGLIIQRLFRENDIKYK